MYFNISPAVYFTLSFSSFYCCNSDYASIVVDGIDYCSNLRGMNIVVICPETLVVKVSPFVLPTIRNLVFYFNLILLIPV